MDMHRFSAICVLLAYLRERHSYPGEKRFEEIREFAWVPAVFEHRSGSDAFRWTPVEAVDLKQDYYFLCQRQFLEACRITCLMAELVRNKCGPFVVVF